MNGEVQAQVHMPNFDGESVSEPDRDMLAFDMANDMEPNHHRQQSTIQWSSDDLQVSQWLQEASPSVVC